MVSQILVLLFAVVSAARGGVLYHRQHGDQLLPQQGYLDDNNVRLVKITRTVAVPYPVQVPVPLHQDVPLVLASSPQLVSVVPRLALIPQHYPLQHYPQQAYHHLQQQPQEYKSDSKPAYSRQQHEQHHYTKQQ
ncbi:uncharacterized protein [Halyomorpha halys]|uniref:uncharacterized protein n=1 Tax=Halyomorpha halys TaxID=286706 RepID=UPI0006D4DDFD|nr:uncharacterized protein LOC106687732 [Halyomorpha halys]XP_014287254.1 uncharacterized protein LOC106687732 [Halyomorpha halys]